MIRMKGRYAVTEEWFQELENEDDEEYQDEIDFITEGDVVKLWTTIEQYRRAIAWQDARFKRWLEVSPQLQKHWKQFTDAGGVTADDFSKFCAGRMRHKSTRENKHLRLISKKSNPAIKFMRPKQGNDAA
jgi:hypothetical protein